MLITVEDGKAIQIRGAPDHPPTGGTLCTKVARYLERTYSPERVLHPMRRVGKKGEGRFERISWDEALDTIAGNSPRSPLRRTARRRSCRTRTRARWAFCNPARWIAASSTGSARRCSTAPSARRPARPAGPRRSVRRSAPTSSTSSTAG
jgi:anaerobic selenocysteine-containing dehydrogenase